MGFDNDGKRSKPRKWKLYHWLALIITLFIATYGSVKFYQKWRKQKEMEKLIQGKYFY